MSVRGTENALGPQATAILDRIGFRCDEVLHPVDLITVEKAATMANVAATTVDSAIRNADSFREAVLGEAISRLDATPGSATWDALRTAVGPDGVMTSALDLDEVLADVLHARFGELASDPAFPMLLSGFDQLDRERVSQSVNDRLRRLATEFWPFVTVACARRGRTCPAEPTPALELATTFTLVVGAYLQILEVSDSGAPQKRDLSAMLSVLILAQLDADVSPLAQDLFGDSATTSSSVSGVGEAAVDAAVEMLLLCETPPATSLSVSEATRRGEVSTATLYRTFGSLKELQELILSRSTKWFVGGYSDEFFEELIAKLSERSLDLHEGFAFYARESRAERLAHIAAGRHGRHITPWLASPTAKPVIVGAIRDFCDARVEGTSEFARALSRELQPRFSKGWHTVILHAVSLVSELLLRNSPNAMRASAVLFAGQRDLVEWIFVPLPSKP